MQIRRINEIAKSTTPDSTEDSGIARRGKYTFEMRLALATRLLEDIPRPPAKKVQGMSPVRLKSGYGMPSEGIFASLPKKMLNTSMVNSGWMMAQDAPS